MYVIRPMSLLLFMTVFLLLTDFSHQIGLLIACMFFQFKLFFIFISLWHIKIKKFHYLHKNVKMLWQGITAHQRSIDHIAPQKKC